MQRENTIVFGESVIQYTLVKRRRKSIGITITDDGEVKVAAPTYASHRQIKELIYKKASWILNKLEEVKKINAVMQCRRFVEGEKFLFLGKEYTLKLLKQVPGNLDSVFISGDNLVVNLSLNSTKEEHSKQVKGLLLNWYRERFAEVVEKRVNYYRPILNVSPARVVIKEQKTRWGSCSSKGNINLNWKLIMAPLSVIDYVVVHELCHLRIMNHSKEFWNLVSKIIPDYAVHKKWLRDNGPRLFL